MGKHNTNHKNKMKLNTTRPSRKGFTLVELLVVMAIIAVLASIATPLVLNKRREADKTKAIGHAKQCLIAFVEFEGEEGTRPGQQIVDEGNLDDAAAASSNDCFRQLLQRLPTVRSEAIFFAPSKISKNPDNDIGESPDFSKACEDGEVGFLYVDAPTSRDGAPLMAAPLFDTSGLFDFQAYNGKAVVLKTDGSVEALDIDEDTEQVLISSGGSEVELLSSGNKTFREAPEIKYPIER